VIQAGVLLEREDELGLISKAVSSASAGRGTALLVEGPAGIGKTVLCEAACEQAQEAGLKVSKATGSLLEQDFSYGVTRQLFEPLLRAEPSKQRARLLRGAAGPAGQILLGRSGPEGKRSEPERLYAILHGLYGLTANLAARRPLVVVVDDAQWADPASQRFLFHLARRIEDLAVLLVVALRTGEPGSTSPELAGLRGLRGVTSTYLAPLSPTAVARLVLESIGPPANSFVESCHQATGGVPYFVVELLATLAADGVAPSAEAAQRVTSIGPATVGHATLLRLANLGASATSVARAVAVLGPHADVKRVSAVAGLGSREVLEALDLLVKAGIFADGGLLRFAHPILHASVYDELLPGTREQAHLDAARILSEENADPEMVAAHLLATSSGTAGQARRWLKVAAERALERGAPESAIAYLRRLLAETRAKDDRATVLHELGQAEALVHHIEAIGHLTEALELTADPARRAAIVCHLADAMGAAGLWEERIPLIEAAIEELPGEELEARLELERRQAGLEAYDTRYASAFERNEPERRDLVGRGHPAGRALALLLGAVVAWRSADSEEVRLLIRQGLDEGRFLADQGAAAPSLSQAVGALLLTEHIEEAKSLVEDLFADACRRGSLFGLMQAHVCRVWVAVQTGDLAGAEADMLSGVDMANEFGDLLGLVCTLRFGLDAMLERDSARELGHLADRVAPGPGWCHTLTGGFLFEVRGCLLLEAGQRQEAVSNLRAAGEIYQELGFLNPLMAAWRPALALAVGGKEAERLISQELSAASRSGLPRAFSRAYRTKGLLLGGERGIELLRRAVAEAERCPSRLEEARCQIELGAALRRAGRSGESRPALTAGLQLAESCGAERLAARALEELRLGGAKPRRRAIFGPGSLTPAEQRVARLASAGLTNQEIAKALFVSPKTVENQLGHVYRKLGVGGRLELVEVLSEAGLGETTGALGRPEP
jgi:DNA-binding CsgD family transcriptional regulator/tetratricopeptide (TPR) repeat protein